VDIREKGGDSSCDTRCDTTDKGSDTRCDTRDQGVDKRSDTRWDTRFDTRGNVGYTRDNKGVNPLTDKAGDREGGNPRSKVTTPNTSYVDAFTTQRHSSGAQMGQQRAQCRSPEGGYGTPKGLPSGNDPPEIAAARGPPDKKVLQPILPVMSLRPPVQASYWTVNADDATMAQQRTEWQRDKSGKRVSSIDQIGGGDFDRSSSVSTSGKSGNGGNDGNGCKAIYIYYLNILFEYVII
jgi:hypothetical protein